MQEVRKVNPFAKPTLVPEEVKHLYDHGFTLEEVVKLKQLKLSLDRRDFAEEPVTLEEFKTIVVPWQRIHRTEAFILNPVKVKAPRKTAKRVTTTRTPRIAKPKKLTKKALGEKLSSIIFKQAIGQEVTKEELDFLAEHTSELKPL